MRIHVLEPGFNCCTQDHPEYSILARDLIIHRPESPTPYVLTRTLDRGVIKEILPDLFYCTNGFHCQSCRLGQCASPSEPSRRPGLHMVT